MAISGCASLSSPVATCPSCEEQNRETARLRQDLAAREAELRELRSSQREQQKVIEESTREAARAKVKLRRLATQAEAASYIADVEVALESLRAARDATPFLELAQSLVASTAAPFAEGDYATVMDRAEQAEQMIAVMADVQSRSRSRGASEVLLRVPIALRVVADSPLRRQPRRNVASAGVLKQGSPVVARAYKGSWLRVETEDTRSGWVEPSRLRAR
jgi:hypothetical protein